MIEDWSIYPNFSKAEFDCQQTGKNGMRPEALGLFQAIRDHYGRPMQVTSGYRSPAHILEKVKVRPGSHAAGLAADFAIPPAHRYRFIKIAQECEAAGIGVHGDFIHIDAGHPHMPRPWLWPY